MSEDQLRELLGMMSRERMPIDYSGDQFGLRGVPSMPQEVPQELRDLSREYLRASGYQDTPVGRLGASYGNEPGQQGMRASYENAMNLLGGLLGVKGEIGKDYKKGSVSYSPTENLSFGGSITSDQFGNMLRSLQAQYMKKLNEDLMMGVVGRGGSNPYVGLQMLGRF